MPSGQVSFSVVVVLGVILAVASVISHIRMVQADSPGRLFRRILAGFVDTGEGFANLVRILIGLGLLAGYVFSR